MGWSSLVAGLLAAVLSSQLLALTALSETICHGRTLSNINKPPTLQETPLHLVSSPLELSAALEDMQEQLAVQPCLAMDVEHHHKHSYLGFTCLLQLSTGESGILPQQAIICGGQCPGVMHRYKESGISLVYLLSAEADGCSTRRLVGLRNLPAARALPL